MFFSSIKEINRLMRTECQTYTIEKNSRSPIFDFVGKKFEEMH